MLHNDKAKFSVDATREIANNGGFSFSLGGKKPETGFMVSLPGFETVQPLDVVSAGFNYEAAGIRKAVFLYLESVSPIVESVFPSAFVGGWVHSKKLYLDLSLSVPCIHDALRLAKAWNQIAIYDVSNGISLELAWFKPSAVATGLQPWSTGKHYPVAVCNRGGADCVYLPLSPMGIEFALYTGENADEFAQQCFDAVNR